jgi:hypothetical protein
MQPPQVAVCEHLQTFEQQHQRQVTFALVLAF